MSELPNIFPALPEIFLALMAVLLLLIGAFSKGNRTGSVVVLSVLALVVASLLTMAGCIDRVTGFGGMFSVDGFTIFTKVLVIAAAGLTLSMSLSWLRSEKLDKPEYPVLVLFAVVGMMIMVSASNLIALYLGIELQSLSLYIMAAFYRESGRSSEAGLKYFVLGSLASGMLLYGLSLIYGFAGTMGFDSLASAFYQSVPTGVVIGLIFVIAGLAFKLSAAPFHMWAPDVYEGAPTPVTAFFAVAPKIAAFSLLLRVLFGPFAAVVEQWQQVIIFLSAFSMIIGAFGAIAQTNIKRMMAYSSIGHVGYLLMGVAVGTVEGVRGVLIYLAIYLLMNVGSFAVILTMRRNGRPLEEIEDLAGTSETHPMLALSLMIFMFSMAGIPPFAGFWAKWYVFGPAIAKGGIFIGLAVMGVLTSVVGAFYYIRIIKVMYFDKSAEPLDKGMDKVLGVVMAVCAALILLLVAPGPLVTRAASAAVVLFGG